MNTRNTPEFYYEWGDEKPGYVSTGYYDANDVWRECDKMTRIEAEKLGLIFNNPHS